MSDGKGIKGKKEGVIILRIKLKGRNFNGLRLSYGAKRHEGGGSYFS